MSETTRLDRLAAVFREAPDEVFIQPHNVPDPDAIASCAGLRWLLGQRGVKAEVVFDRDIEKVDSLKMLELFDIAMTRADLVSTLGKEDWALLVDGQKGGGNLSDLATNEVAAIDHHEYRPGQGYRYEDVRPQVGACSSIVAEYAFEAGLEPPTNIATALLFGIMKDTDSLTRGVSELDISMFYKLYHHADMSLIKRLNGSQLKFRDLELYAEAFKTVEAYGNIGFLRLDSPDDSLLGAASDIVLSLDVVEIVVAYSMRPTGLKLSIRSELPSVKANDLSRRIVDGKGFAGGHDHMAGGFMPLDRLPAGRSPDTYVRYKAIGFVESLKE